MSTDTFTPVEWPKYEFNWIPPSARTKHQMRITDEFHEQIGEWGDLMFEIRDTPVRMLDCELEKKALGKLLPRIHQLSGSCVGAGWWRAFCNAMIGDIVLRGDAEDIKLAFPWYTYGHGRREAGMRGRGEGSFGGAQAKAGAEYGALAIDHPKVPQGKIKDGWLSYSSGTEIEWSYSPKFPVDAAELDPDAKPHAIGEYKRLKSAEDVKQAKALGYGVTLASNFGTRGCRVVEDILLAEWNGSWAHQMSCPGYWQHPSLDLLFAIDNQWNDVHGKCPTLHPMGVTGTFWIKAATMDRICEDGEVYAHTSTGGFKLTSIDWENLGLTFA